MWEMQASWKKVHLSGGLPAQMDHFTSEKCPCGAEPSVSTRHFPDTYATPVFVSRGRRNKQAQPQWLKQQKCSESQRSKIKVSVGLRSLCLFQGRIVPHLFPASGDWQ